MVRRSVLVVAVSVVLVGIAALPASATWSIIAVDPKSGEVGAAMAACSPVSALGEPDEVPAPLILAPGRGVAVAQGSVDPVDLDQLRTALGDPDAGDADAVIVAVVADNDPDLQPVRQYAVVVDGSVASVDGLETEPIASAVTGPQVAAQGVSLASDAVVVDALAAYTDARSGGASLADALVRALEAGSSAGGDRRCGDQTALFAHVSVAPPGDDGVAPSRLLTVTVDEGDGQNPVRLLAEAHREGRTGWVDAGLRSPTTLPRWLVLVVGLAMAAASVLVIRRGMGYRRLRGRGAAR